MPRFGPAAGPDLERLRLRALGHQRVDLLHEIAEIGVEPVARMRQRVGDLRGDAAGMGGQHENAVAHQHRLLDIVRHHQDRLDVEALLVPEVEQVGAQRLRRQHVERRERLVHQQDFRLHDERAGEADALAHAAGKLLGVGGLEAVEPDRVDGLERAFARLDHIDAGGARPDLDIVEHGQPGEQREALEHHRDAFGRPVDRPAVERHRALGRPCQAGNEPQQGRLAAAGTSEQRDDLARTQGERDVLQDRRALLARALGEALADVGDVEQRRLGHIEHGAPLKG